MSECVFCDIIEKKIPASIVFEDENMIIIKDIKPQASIHLLLIPKKHYANIMEMSDEDAVILGKCLKKLSGLLVDLGLNDGFRLVSNAGMDACQSVAHLHIHILGGEQLSDKMA